MLNINKDEIKLNYLYISTGCFFGDNYKVIKHEWEDKSYHILEIENSGSLENVSLSLEDGTKKVAVNFWCYEDEQKWIKKYISFLKILMEKAKGYEFEVSLGDSDNGSVIEGLAEMKSMINVPQPDEVSYYSNELENVIPETEEESSCVSIKVTLGNRSTKWMSLNLDCIDSLEEYLSILKRHLE